MKRFITFSVAAALAAGMANSAWSQGGQGEGGGTSGGAGATGTSGLSDTAAGTATGNTSGAAGRARIGAGQNQAGANARVGARRFNQSSQPQSPFFADPGARQQLNLNDNQFNQLSRAYQDAYNRYNQGVSGLNNNNNALTDQQRMRQIEQYQARLNQDFNTSLDTTLTDPQTRARFDQLNRQYQGPAAFNQPAVRQQLNLNDDQQRQLRRLQQAWRQGMNELRRSAHSDGGLTQQQLNALRTQYQDQLGTILSPAQQQTWSQMIGQPYEFPVNVYVPSGAAATGQAGVQNQQQQQQQQFQQGTPRQSTQPTTGNADPGGSTVR